MKPKIIRFESSGADYLSIIKNGIIIDIACSEKNARMLSEENNVKLSEDDIVLNSYIIKVQLKDLALYTHWPQHAKEFWNLFK